MCPGEYWALLLAGLFDTRESETREVFYQFREPFVMGAGKFEGLASTSWRLGLAFRGTLDWHRAQPV